MKEKIYETFDELLSDLTSREKDVFLKRLGLEDKRYSLEDIGKQYDLTRERIRQIQNEAVNKLQRKILVHPFLKKEFYHIIESHLGKLKIKRYHYLKIKFQDSYSLDEQSLKILRALLKIHPLIYFFNENEIYNEFVYLKENDFNNLNKFTHHILNFLDSQSVISENQFFEFLRLEIKNHFGLLLNIDEILEFVKLYKVIAQNPFNEFGYIANWRINPNSLIDKINLILELEGKPLSYYQIHQKLIELSQVEKDLIHYSWRKSYSLKTVHSTLNSNKDFILVGRGIYALRKWGVIEGKIIDIMKKIVKENSGLTISELYQKLSQERIFNKNSFYVYLNKYFKVINKRVYLK